MPFTQVHSCASSSKSGCSSSSGCTRFNQLNSPSALSSSDFKRPCVIDAGVPKRCRTDSSERSARRESEHLSRAGRLSCCGKTLQSSCLHMLWKYVDTQTAMKTPTRARTTRLQLRCPVRNCGMLRQAGTRPSLCGLPGDLPVTTEHVVGQHLAPGITAAAPTQSSERPRRRAAHSGNRKRTITGAGALDLGPLMAWGAPPSDRSLADRERMIARELDRGRQNDRTRREPGANAARADKGQIQRGRSKGLGQIGADSVNLPLGTCEKCGHIIV